jgi:hypothetical protein
MHPIHRRSALTFAGPAAGLSTARAQTADLPEKPLRIIVPYLCCHPGKRHEAIQYAGYLSDGAWERSQTATHIFGPTLQLLFIFQV